MKIKDFLKDPARWTKRVAAGDENNQPVELNSRRAVKFCVLGAASLCYDNGMEFNDVLLKIRGHDLVRPFNGLVGMWNDDPSTTHEIVIKVATDLDV